MKDISAMSVEFTKLVCGRVDPYLEDDPSEDLPIKPLGARLGLEVDGKEVASFRQLRGFSQEIEPADSIESDLTEINWKDAPSKKKPIPLRFGNGRDFGEFIWAWHQLARGNSKEEALKSGKLVQYGTDGMIAAEYTFENAWLSKFELSQRVTMARLQTRYQSTTLVCESIIKNLRS